MGVNRFRRHLAVTDFHSSQRSPLSSPTYSLSDFQNPRGVVISTGTRPATSSKSRSPVTSTSASPATACSSTGTSSGSHNSIPNGRPRANHRTLFAKEPLGGIDGGRVTPNGATGHQRFITDPYTLNRTRMISPSATTYSFPSTRISPASFTACSDPCSANTPYGMISARMKPRSMSL